MAETIRKPNLETAGKSETTVKQEEDGTGVVVLVPSMAEIQKQHSRRVKEDRFIVWPQIFELRFERSRIPELGVKGSKILPFQNKGAMGMEPRAGANAATKVATMLPPWKPPFASFCRPEKALRPPAKPANNEALGAMSTTEMMVTCREKRGGEEREWGPSWSRWAAERPPSKPPDFAVKDSGGWAFMPLKLWCCEGGGAIVYSLCFPSAKKLLHGSLRLDTKQKGKVVLAPHDPNKDKCHIGVTFYISNVYEMGKRYAHIVFGRLGQAQFRTKRGAVIFLFKWVPIQLCTTMRNIVEDKCLEVLGLTQINRDTKDQKLFSIIHVVAHSLVLYEDPDLILCIANVPKKLKFLGLAHMLGHQYDKGVWEAEKAQNSFHLIGQFQQSDDHVPVLEFLHTNQVEVGSGKETGLGKISLGDLAVEDYTSFLHQRLRDHDRIYTSCSEDWINTLYQLFRDISVGSSIVLFEDLLAGDGKMSANSFMSGFAFEDGATVLFQPVCIIWIYCKLFFWHRELGNISFSSPMKIFTNSYMFWTLCFRLWDPG